jgi:hypothetical protein
MRIVSLLPSATDMIAELGLLDSLVGVSEDRNCRRKPQESRWSRGRRSRACAPPSPGSSGRVFVAEWDDPPYGSGHWLPEMVEAAGGANVLSKPGEYSFATTWDAVLAEEPGLIVLAACSFASSRRSSAARTCACRCGRSSTATRTSPARRLGSRTA